MEVAAAATPGSASAARANEDGDDAGHARRLGRLASACYRRAPCVSAAADLAAAGLQPGPRIGVALRVLPRAVKRLGRDEALAELAGVVADPEANAGHA